MLPSLHGNNLVQSNPMYVFNRICTQIKEPVWCSGESVKQISGRLNLHSAVEACLVTFGQVTHSA